MNESIKAIVDNLSDVIASELAILSSEYWTPRFTPDQSDSELKFRKDRIKFLRDMREAYENMMFGLSREGF